MVTTIKNLFNATFFIALVIWKGIAAPRDVNKVALLKITLIYLLMATIILLIPIISITLILKLSKVINVTQFLIIS